MENFETVSVPVSAAVAGGSCGLSHVWFFVIPWTVAHQAPLFMGFSRQEYWSGLPFPSPAEAGEHLQIAWSESGKHFKYWI